MKFIKEKFFRDAWRIHAAFILSIMAAWVCQASYVNPLKGDLGVHDPVMTKEGNTYYIFYTGGLVNRKTSTDRITWKNGNAALAKAPSWFTTYVPDNKNDTWAPDISYRDGKWWLYYAVSTSGSRVSAIGLATNATLNSSDARYSWADEGMVINSTSSNDYNCIDPNAFQDVDSTLWLVFGSWWTGIKLVQLNPATGKLLGNSPALTALASHSSGIEGAFLIKWKQYYYLFVSWDNCCKGVNSNYKIAVGRASALKGPYVDKKNNSMISGAGELLDTGDAIRKGPGHNGIFIEHDTVFCVNHYYDANRNGTATLQIRPVYWEENDWPSLKPLTNAMDRSPSGAGIFSPRSTAVRLIGKGAGIFGKTPWVLFSISGQRVKYAAAQALPMRIYIEEK